MSKIEVNTVEPQCGTTVTVGKCTTTVAVPGNVVKSNALQASDGGNIVNQCGTDITLGASGDTIALAAGASQTGFGRTGTVDWDTSIKTGTVTAVSGSGYFVNTTAGGITVNLPAGSVGSIVAVSDYASTAASNAITITPNGSDNINGGNYDYLVETAGLAVTLVYADATRGWKSVTGSDADATGKNELFVTATGGTPCAGAVVCTDYKQHTFTAPGAFCVSCAGNACGSNTVDYLVVAGGGGGGAYYGGGGGGGGYRESSGTASGSYNISPLGACVAALPVSASCYPITVGGGGAGASTPGIGTAGNPSIFSTITSTAGGYGGGLTTAAGAGGSGGGGSGPCSGATGGRAGGAGNSPPVSPAQGMPGVTVTAPQWAGAGGGATVAGSVRVGGTGGTSAIDGTPTGRAGGGGGGPDTGTPPSPGATAASCGGGIYNVDGTVNTGGGGGSDTASGGSGIVIIRYKFQ